VQLRRKRLCEYIHGVVALGEFLEVLAVVGNRFGAVGALLLNLPGC
jgi:hypothetical protein